MIYLCAWALLTAGVAYLMSESGHRDGWAKRCRAAIVARGGLLGRMLSCFRCPWGWSGLIVAGGMRAWMECAPIVREVSFWVFVPVAGLGLAHLVAYLSPTAAMRIAWEREHGTQAKGS
ncbi:MAG: hypothetical protein WCC69_11770 [Pirellulales bacterium]